MTKELDLLETDHVGELQYKLLWEEAESLAHPSSLFLDRLGVLDG